MMTTMADLMGELRRDGTASRNHSRVVLRCCSEAALSTLCGSSMMTRSPREPVIEPAAIASRKPVALFSNLVLTFWSSVMRTRSPQCIWYQSDMMRRRMRTLSRIASAIECEAQT